MTIKFKTVEKQNFKPEERAKFVPGNLICLSKKGRDFHGFKDEQHPAILLLLLENDNDTMVWKAVKDDQLSWGWYLGDVDFWEVLS